MSAPAVGLVIALLWVGSVVGGIWLAYGAGRDATLAQQATTVQADARKALRDAARAAQAARDDAKQAAQAVRQVASAHDTLVQEVRHEISQAAVYRDCVHPAGQLQRLNAAAGHPPEGRPPGDRQLSLAPHAPPDGGHLRRNDRGVGGGAGGVPAVPGGDRGDSSTVGGR